MHYREKSPEKYLNLPKKFIFCIKHLCKLTFRLCQKRPGRVSDFCQIGNLAAFRFLPKKEPAGIPVSNKRRNLWAFRFLPKRETWRLSGFNQRRNLWAFLVQSAGQPVVTRQCSPAPRPEKKLISEAFGSSLMGQFHEICFLPFTSYVTI
jgi:hypothetical protein